MTATTASVGLRGPNSPSAPRKRAVSFSTPVIYFVALILVGLMLVPVAYIILGGFRSNSEITVDPSGLPVAWNVGNYLEVLGSEIFWRQVTNSAIAAIVTTLFVVILGLMASFVLARYTFRGRGAMYALFSAGLMFPMTVAITPLYILVKNLGLTNSLAGVIIPQIAFALPVTVIIMVPFLQAIPNELQEAAEIDGCSRIGFF
jgi:raffinose/stachyose/melibiose transport system permease protein